MWLRGLWRVNEVRYYWRWWVRHLHSHHLADTSPDSVGQGRPAPGQPAGRALRHQPRRGLRAAAAPAGLRKGRRAPAVGHGPARIQEAVHHVHHAGRALRLLAGQRVRPSSLLPPGPPGPRGRASGGPHPEPWGRSGTLAEHGGLPCRRPRPGAVYAAEQLQRVAVQEPMVPQEGDSGRRAHRCWDVYAERPEPQCPVALQDRNPPGLA
mmetsp:Transcript_103313/g.292552  ORF Transcript_103313/g.292552 Transcript_103313/m.292552 type:complete len:209 (+) Transcript_103313:529-1155(+)